MKNNTRLSVYNIAVSFFAILLIILYGFGPYVSAQVMPEGDVKNTDLGAGSYSVEKDCSVVNAITDAQTSGGSTTSPAAASGNWSSGLEAPYILEQFAIETLKDIAAKRNVSVENTVTEEHVIALVAFMLGEGGDINNQDLFNPLNTGINAPDLLASANSSSGVQSFKSFDAGVEATARTMVMGTQSRLADSLTIKDSTADQFMDALSHYSNYPGNKYWAQASTNAAYYQQRLDLVKTVRKNYASIAGLVLGTPKKEQPLGITAKEKLLFHPAGDTSSSTNSATSSGTDSIVPVCGNTGATVDIGTGKGAFTDNTSINWPGVSTVLKFAKDISDLNGSVFHSYCGSKGRAGKPNCYQYCENLSGMAWGYINTGSYRSALAHWDSIANTSHGHPGDRNPPVGALLYYDSGRDGHVATYLGNNMVLSNDIGDSKSGVKGGAYIVSASDIESGAWRLHYAGWGDPFTFTGSKYNSPNYVYN